MESSQFINQTRLSKKQLQLHMQQQQQNQNKYFLDSQHDNNYHIQQQQQRCQYYPSTSPIPHFPGPPISLDYPQNAQCIFEQPQQQQHSQKIASPTHRLASIKKFHQSDPNSIEVCIDYENHHNNVGVVGSSKASSIKWNRNNITATMEKYEPTVKHNNHSNHNHRGHVTMSHHQNRNNSSNINNNSNKQNHQFTTAKMHDDYLNEIHHLDYAYAYYEPGVPMRHQNIPDYYEEAGPSRAPPPNSIRALLSTARRNHMQRTSGKYTIPPTNTSQRSQENVYEEIRDSEKRRMRTGDSIVSLNQNMVEEEFRRVHNRHQRVLGELNLDVEEMLMPASIPQPTAVNFIPTTPMLDPSDPMDFLGNGEVNDGSNGAGNNDNIINNSRSNYSNNVNNNIDLDSGFSGSNSSYIGSLRYQKTNAAALNNSTIKTPTQLSISHQHTDSGSSSFYGGSSGSTTEATDEIVMTSLCRSSSSLYESGKMSKTSKSSSSSPSAMKFNSTAVRQGVNDKTERASFWKVKGRGWMSKLPGFSSTSSINKIGMALFCIWTDESERCPTINSPFH